MVSNDVRIVRNIGVLVCPKCQTEAHSVTASRATTVECECGYAYIRGQGSYVSSVGFMTNEYKVDEYYFKGDAIVDKKTGEMIFVKREYDKHELYPEQYTEDDL